MKGETLEQLRQWGEHRRYFDRTREQPQMGQALLDLLDDREDWMRRAAIALDRAERAEEREGCWRGLLDTAMHLHENCESALGHERTTWTNWYHAVRAFSADVDAEEDDE